MVMVQIQYFFGDHFCSVATRYSRKIAESVLRTPAHVFLDKICDFGGYIRAYFKYFGMGFRKIVQDLNMQRGQLCEMKVSERILSKLFSSLTVTEKCILVRIMKTLYFPISEEANLVLIQF
jgi:hypothetical protein